MIATGWVLMMNICMFDLQNDIVCVEQKADNVVYEERRECEKQVDQYEKFKAWCKPVKEKE